MRLRPDGWLTGVHRRPSPNADDRPDPEDVSLLVVHNISLPPKIFGGPGVYQLFENRLDPNAHPFYAEIADLRVSAHLWIRRTGAMVQFVSLTRRAWHAGVSQWQGRERCNDFSIGIELEGCDDRPFTRAQYQQLSCVITCIGARYPRITPARIVGHSDIAPGRKTDPGPHFDWERLRRALDGGDVRGRRGCR
ncbi:MAG: 1,6-anhydro-N-acetylmuramyl-L-alanine amidase AmpD [Oceanococcaceae bacterium]